MNSPASAGPAGRTRWTRLAFVMIPVFFVAAVLIAAVGLGALPVSLAVSARTTALSGQTFQVAAERLDGSGFTQYAVLDHTARGDYPDAVSVIRSADLYGMCQSMVTRVPLFGRATVRITAGGDGTPAHAENLVVRTDDLRGDAEFRNLLIGADAGPLGGAPGGIGQTADSVSIGHLRQQNRSISAGTFRLNGLHLSVKPTQDPCY